MQLRADGSLRTVYATSGTVFPVHIVPLPGSRGVLINQCQAVPCAVGQLDVVDLQRDTIRTLVAGATRAWYLDRGYLVYGRGDGTLVAQRFDADRLELSGTPVAVLTGVASTFGFPQCVIAPNGTVLYGSGASTEFVTQGALLDVDRTGKATVVESNLSLPPTIGSAGVSLSPDGSRVALVQVNDNGTDIYIKTLPDGPTTRVTFSGKASRPSWSPDGRDLLYKASEGNAQFLMRMPANGGGAATEVLRDNRPIAEGLLSPDGAWLVWRTDDVAAGSGDILGRRTGGDTATIELVTGPFTELSPAVSPDGRWLAYSSNQNGTPEVFVRALSDTSGGVWQVSNGGGYTPQWSHDGRELYFVGPDGMRAAQVETAPTFRSVRIETLFDASPYVLDEIQHATYSVTRNGHFLVTRRNPATADSTTRTRIILIEHWLSEIGPVLPK